MKYRIFLFLSLSMIALAANAQMTNSVLPSTESLQVKILADRYGSLWSKTWTNLTVKKGGCPPWGCSFPPMILLIDPAKETQFEFVKRLRETDIPRLPARPTLTDSFSVALPPAIKPFRTAR
jgi:hypothetical protein